MLYDIIFNYHKDFKQFQPYPPANNREFWQGLPDNVKEGLVKSAERFLKYQYPVITASLYMEFSRSGNREKYETVFIDRRRKLNTFILAECVEGKGRFLDDIINGIFVICEESGWQLPAHNYYLKWAPIYCLPDKENPIIDLFAAETGALLATAAYLLNFELHEVCPFIVERIDKEIRERILTPYLKDRYGWEGGWQRPVNNWTTWITQNILITLFTRRNLTERDACQVLHQAAVSLDYFLDEYGEDGCCNEGAGYYRHAGLCFYGALEVMNTITDGAFDVVYQNKKIYNMATFIMNMHVNNEYYLNFGDNSCKPGCSGVREFLFAERVGSKEMMQFAAMEHQRDTDKLMEASYNLFYRLLAVCEERKIAVYNITNQLKIKNVWYESTGLLIARDSRYVLAAKGGGNNESHNHNDTGSFILYKYGKPLVIDIGVETYFDKTFSAERYDIWTMQSFWHNVINFGEIQQLSGENYQSQVKELSVDETRAFMKLELSGVYPGDTLRSYERSFEFCREGKIEIKDSFQPDFEGTCFALITVEKPVWRQGVLLLGEIEKVEAEPVKSVEIEEVILKDKKLKEEWGDKIYRTRIYPDGAELTIQFIGL